MENVQHTIADKDKDLTMSPPAGRPAVSPFSFLHHYRIHSFFPHGFFVGSFFSFTRPTLFPRLVYPSLSSVCFRRIASFSCGMSFRSRPRIYRISLSDVVHSLFNTFRKSSRRCFDDTKNRRKLSSRYTHLITRAKINGSA